ncbi:MAG TPA: hypothetical protein VH479_15390 [Acidimicrobiales bacterium]
MRRHLCTISVLVAALGISGCGSHRPETATAARGAPDGAPIYEANLTVQQDEGHGPEACVISTMSLPPGCGGLPIVGWDWDAVDGEETYGPATWGSFHVTGTYTDGALTLTEPAGPPRGDDGAAVPPLPPACDNPEVVDPTQDVVQWGTVDISGPDLVSTWVNDRPPGVTDGPFTANVVVLPGAGPAVHDRIRQTYAGGLCVVERQAHTLDELTRVQNEAFDADAVAHFGTPLSGGVITALNAVRVEVWVADQPALDYAQQRWGDRVVLEGVLEPVG